MERGFVLSENIERTIWVFGGLIYFIEFIVHIP